MSNKEPNAFLVQLRGPFSKNHNLLEDLELENRFIKKIGIQITPEVPFEVQARMPQTASHEIRIGHLEDNDDVFIIGATGILEMDDLKLTQNEISVIQFQQDENELTLVDLILDTNIIDSEGGK